MRKTGVFTAIPVFIIGLCLIFLTGCGAKAAGIITPETTSSEIPASISQVKEEGLAPWKYVEAKVTKITDGDTIEVNYKGKSYKVRFLDVDTPESVKEGVAVQPYGKEATEFTKKMLKGKKVRLVFEEGLKDKYGRLLAHVILKDGTYFNAELVKKGFARVESVKPNLLLKNYFEGLMEEAIGNNVGLWKLPTEKRPFVKNSSGYYVPSYRKVS